MDTQSLFNVEGKVVLVTGGAKGIGRMISEGYVTNGATVYISSRDAKACEQAAKELNAIGRGKAYAIPADFYKEEECKRLAEEIAKRESKLHVLVNNSGSNWGAPYDEYPSSAWSRVLTLNLHRVFDLTKLLTPLLEKAGAPNDPARIINIGSIDGLRVPALETFAYSASKAGLHHLSRVLANHLGKRNITSNTLACGPFQSKMMAATLEKFRDAIEGANPLGRIGTPQDVAGACLFLSSRAGAYINGIVILYPYGNLSAIDAYLFGVSSSTESGLNPYVDLIPEAHGDTLLIKKAIKNSVDLKELKTYQQLFLYFVPIVSNAGFINILVVVVRLYWFEKRLNKLESSHQKDPEAQPAKFNVGGPSEANTAKSHSKSLFDDLSKLDKSVFREHDCIITENDNNGGDNSTKHRQISFADNSKALYIPSPREHDRGLAITEMDDNHHFKPSEDDDPQTDIARHRSLVNSIPLERVASSMFVLGAYPSRSQERQSRRSISLAKDSELPYLSSQASLGRNSRFYNLTSEDREKLGGIEYRSLRLLLKITLGYFVGLHVFGVICLVPWIQNADPKYRDYLKDCGQGKIWWALYTAQTMVDNLGFALTPDSMILFRDAAFPMFILSFLAYAGHTMYPCFLRLIIWIMFKCAPKHSLVREPLSFLLNYPRRCYTLLFRSRPTWVLFGILFVLNFVDVLLIVVLDLHNPAINTLSGGQRVLAAIFQAASARHTGTASFNLAEVNPAVQFSLLVMMYISIFPIAISIRASNTYEESALGLYPSDHAELDESNGMNYVLTHMRNQLSFDLWYIFLGIFCICATEARRIMDPSEPAFSVFAIFFEVVSA
ncbi:putative potassium uptake transporter [Aspergillus thermomutatus]